MGCPKRPPICSIDGCDKPTYRRDLCVKHTKRLIRNGHPLAGRTFEGEPERFMRDVAAKYAGDGCLPWPHRTNPQGYAQLTGGANVCRIICEAVNGPPPAPDYEAAHTCGHGADGCVNGKHLRWATRAENEADKVLHGTSNRGERCGSARLTREQVLEIRALAGTMFNRELADRYGVTETTVRDIRHRRRWAWLNDDGTEQMPTHLAAEQMPMLAHGRAPKAKPKSHLQPDVVF